MVDWCAEHGIIIPPQYLPAGDYTLLSSNIIGDRKDNILELYKDFQVRNIGNPMTIPFCVRKFSPNIRYIRRITAPHTTA